ncbi:MAG: hypothetical protein ACRCXZ_00170 [Patescibacteria group bacterium]
MNKYELTIKNLNQLEQKLRCFPLGSSVHLTDKLDNLDSVLLLDRLSDYIITTTFSVRNHYFGGDLDSIFSTLQKKLIEIKKYTYCTELLIVSGANRGKIDALHILNELNKRQNEFPIGVAYNSNSINQIEENQRLVSKLSYPFVKSVYIQLTDDLVKIERGIDFIKSIDPDINIAVCILQPSNRILNVFKNRPWKGVVFSKEYLDNEGAAQILNKKITQFLSNKKVDYLWTI